jgi:glycosyltransferase involved in cell wall biosynthesis
MFEGVQGSDQPQVTIAIPTFRRPGLLIEAVASALVQEGGGATEIIVVDNDPESSGAEALVAGLPRLRDVTFRYYVNSVNIGMFANWNRCIQLARGQWTTILNDDDLLDDNFVQLMLAELACFPDADGIVSRQRFFDQRLGATQVPTAGGVSLQDHRRKVNWSTAARLLASGRDGRHRFLAAACGRLEEAALFGGGDSRRVTPRTLFFGSMLGNGAGFLFRTQTARQIGGFYAEEFPSADYWFYTRMAAHFHLRQHRATAASVRLAENETAKPDSVRAALKQGYAIQRCLAGTHVPSWWRYLSPAILALHRGYFREVWHMEFSDSEFEALLGVKAKPERRSAMRFARLFLRGL